MPSSIVRIAAHHMKIPVQVEIAPTGTTADHVTHELFIVQQEMTKELLGTLLVQFRGSVLLFCRTKMGAMRTARALKNLGYSAAEIHSDRSLSQRRQALEGFKSGKYRVLVATDIAARGIDVRNIELVINYDLPDQAEIYVHRVGRTGRAGSPGHAISFARPDQRSDVSSIEHLIRTSLPISRHPEIQAVDFNKPQNVFSFNRFQRSRPAATAPISTDLPRKSSKFCIALALLTFVEPKELR